MTPKLFHLLITFLSVFSIQPYIGQARILKSSHQPSYHFLQNLEGVQKGARSVEGLIELKQYLKKFGYYPSDINNLSSDFDDLLETSLKTYQTYYRLNVTGYLDSDTIKQMKVPRCGVPDIHPLSKRNSSSESKHKYPMVAFWTFFNGAPRWPPSKYHLTYRFGHGVEAVGLDTIRFVCARAFKRWADVSRFTFEEARGGASSDILIAFYSGAHGDYQAFDGPGGGVLAHAFAPQNGSLHYDADEHWSTEPARMDQYDLESVSIHEIGHLLGLAHSQDANAIMYAKLPPATKKRDLTQDDISGIRALYNF